MFPLLALAAACGSSSAVPDGGDARTPSSEAAPSSDARSGADTGTRDAGDGGVDVGTHDAGDGGVDVGTHDAVSHEAAANAGDAGADGETNDDASHQSDGGQRDGEADASKHDDAGHDSATGAPLARIIHSTDVEVSLGGG